jgi:hypothetical protein
VAVIVVVVVVLVELVVIALDVAVVEIVAVVAVDGTCICVVYISNSPLIGFSVTEPNEQEILKKEKRVRN